MKRRTLGKSDLSVSPIGLGCWQFSNFRSLAKYWELVEAKVQHEVVAAALGAGITWFDTAEAYGFGRSERAVAASLRGLGVAPGEVIVATKWFPLGRFATNIRRTIDRRISALSPYPIDLYQIHFPGSFSALPSQLRRMAGLVREGKVRYVGVSNFSADQMRRAHAVLATEGIPLVSNQVRYSLLDRRIERNGVLDAANELGVSIIAYSPLEQGVLTGRFHEDPERLAGLTRVRRGRMRKRAGNLEASRPLIDELGRIAASRGVTVAEVALNWIVSFHGETIVAIPGASKPQQARNNARAMSFELTADEAARIDERSLDALETDP